MPKKYVKSGKTLEISFDSLSSAVEKARKVYADTKNANDPQIEACEHFINFRAGRETKVVDAMIASNMLSAPAGSAHLYIRLS